MRRPVSRTISRRAWATLCLLFLLWTLTDSSLAADEGTLVSELKVAYLYNFTRFVQWPGHRPGEPFVICVIDDEEMAGALRALERDERRAAGGPIRIETLSSPAPAGDCRILFVGAGAMSKLESILDAAAGRPVLLVGDAPGLAGRGVAINFFLKPDILGEGERLRFAIDPEALAGRGLEVSAHLYDVAEILR